MSTLKVSHVLPTEIPFIEILKPWTWVGGQSEKEWGFQRGHLGTLESPDLRFNACLLPASVLRGQGSCSPR